MSENAGRLLYIRARGEEEEEKKETFFAVEMDGYIVYREYLPFFLCFSNGAEEERKTGVFRPIRTTVTNSRNNIMKLMQDYKKKGWAVNDRAVYRREGKRRKAKPGSSSFSFLIY
jgi:hypothetical protein